jgi:hypothetical protein
MIYEVPPLDAPIQQGDIFRGVPRIEISLDALAVLEEDEQLEKKAWKDILSGNDPARPETVTAVLPIKPVLAIVITQNCDAVRGHSLSLCEIDSYLTEREKANPPTTPKKWQSKIMEDVRKIPRLFYLPADGSVGIGERMEVDFRSVLRVRRTDLEAMREHRIARLNHVANEHFRETLAQFFRRYPVNEWYPLTKEEFETYAESKKPEPVEPYPWQS